jgi:hypothetical protein
MISLKDRAFFAGSSADWQIDPGDGDAGSLEIAATNPLVFSAVMALMALFIAYGRYMAPI